MKLDPDDHQAIAERVAVLMRTPAPTVLPLRDAMKRAGYSSISSFHDWARRIGLRSMRGARGRYAVNSIDSAVDRAARRTGR